MIPEQIIQQWKFSGATEPGEETVTHNAQFLGPVKPAKQPSAGNTT